MAKRIIKEIVIFTLLLIAIILILGILFYDYIPNNKTVPIKIEPYTMPEDVEVELEAAIPEEQNIVRTYYLDDTVLDTYESTNDYEKGKPNPFAAYVDDILNDTTANDLIENSSSETNNTINNGDTTNQNEVYINTPGKNF